MAIFMVLLSPEKVFLLLSIRHFFAVNNFMAVNDPKSWNSFIELESGEEHEWLQFYGN